MEEMEHRARAILETVPDYIWDGESIPVPVEDIVDSVFSLHVMDVTDMSEAPGCPELDAGQSLSGLLLADRMQIWCDASEGIQWPTRRRFTIAHELGHWVLHRPGQQQLFCRRGTVAADGEYEKARKEREPLPEIEREANAFAAALLMPAALIEHHYYDCKRDFDEMCRRFNASGAAMSRRLRAVI